MSNGWENFDPKIWRNVITGTGPDPKTLEILYKYIDETKEYPMENSTDFQFGRDEWWVEYKRKRAERDGKASSKKSSLPFYRGDSIERPEGEPVITRDWPDGSHTFIYKGGIVVHQPA